MSDPCPRCGAERRGEDVCPSCGYAPAHPGVLGSLSAGARTLVSDPRVLLAFSVPALLLVAIEVLFESIDLAAPGPALGVAAVASLYPPLLAYLWIAGALTSRITGRGRPDGHGAIASGAALASLVICLPMTLIALMAPFSDAGGLGAAISLTVLLLALLTLVLAGRAVGLPVEAALSPGSARELVGRGLRRGRENGGLGIVFLALVVFAISAMVLAAPGLADRPLPPGVVLALSGVRSWLLGAWFGASIVHAMAHADPAPVSFACPRCGREARAFAGRGSCECGLEGPVYGM